MDQPNKTSENTMEARLCEMFYVQAIRHEMNAVESNNGFLNALSDKRISKSLEYIHTQPDEAWSTSLLASKVAMSRSAFAKRFNCLIGIPPCAYLTKWRMGLAKSQIRAGQNDLASIAVNIGYTSVTGFTRAYYREFGMTPCEARNSFASI